METSPRRSVCDSKAVILRSEQERVQKKTFTNWLNTYLSNSDPPIVVKDLFVDIRDGVALIRILEVLSKQKLHTEVRPKMQRVHYLANIKTALEFLKSRNIKLVNINPTDIADGKPAIVLGLIWSIILYFQIEEQEEILLRILGLPPGATRTKGTAKDILKTWVEDIFAGNYDVKVRDFGPSWRDGIAFNAMVHNIDSSLVKMDELIHRTPKENLEYAFSQAETYLGIPKLLDPEDVDVERPDEKSIMTYVAQFFKAYPEAGKQKQKNETADSAKPKTMKELIEKMRSVEKDIEVKRNGQGNAVDRQFGAYLKVTDQLNEYEDDLENFRKQSAAEDTELIVAEEAWLDLNEAVDEWKWHLDSLLPDETGTVAEWISRAERYLKSVSKSWHLKGRAAQKLGVSGSPTESWRPSSANPPNSPPSITTLEELVRQQQDIFGSNDHKANSVKNTLNKIVENQGTLEKNVRLPTELLTHLSKRLSEVTSMRPGYMATLEAARARRQFLDILYATRITQTESGFTIQGRRKASATGLEHRLDEWCTVITGSSPEDCKDLVEESLLDYEKCISLEKAPEKLELAQRELQKHYGLMSKLNDLDPQLLPRDAVAIVSSWIDDGENRWNEAKRKRVEKVGSSLKSRLEAWDTLATYTEKTERWLAHADRMIAAQTIPGDYGDVQKWLEEVQKAAQFLGSVSGLQQYELLSDRLKQVSEKIEGIRKAEAQKLEEARMNESAKAEEAFKAHIDQVQKWIKQVEIAMRPTESEELPRNLSCSTESLNWIQQRLEQAMNHQAEMENLVEQTAQLVKSSPLAATREENERNVRNTQCRMDSLCSDTRKLMSDLTDLNGRVGQIESTLEQLDPKVDQVKKWTENISSQREKNYPRMHSEIARLRRNLCTCSGDVDALDGLMKDGRFCTISQTFKLDLIPLKKKLQVMQENLLNAETAINSAVSRLTEWDIMFEQAVNELRASENSLKRIPEANGTKNLHEASRLLKLTQNLLDKLQGIKVNILQPFISKTEALVQPSPDYQFDANTLAAIKPKAEELGERFQDHEEKVIQMQSHLQNLLERLKQSGEEAERASEWLAAQERRLNILGSGPSTLNTLTDMTTQHDGIRLQIDLYTQWAEQFQNFVGTFEMEARPFLKLFHQDEMGGADVTNLVSDEGLSLAKKFRAIEENVKQGLADAKRQLDDLEELGKTMEGAQEWLDKVQTQYSSLPDIPELPDHLDNETGKSERCRSLEQLLEELSSGDLHVKTIKHVIDHISEARTKYDMTTPIMVARRELSVYQTDLGRLQRKIEAELKEAESAHSRFEKLKTEIQKEETWLSEVQKGLPTTTDSLNQQDGEGKSISALKSQCRSEIYKIRKLIGKLNSHGKNAYQRILEKLNQLKHQGLRERLQNWYEKLEELLEYLSRMLESWTAFDNSLTEVDAQANDVASTLADVERQRVQVLNTTEDAFDKSKDTVVDALKHVQYKLNVLLSKRQDIEDKYERLVTGCLAIHFTPSDVIKIGEQFKDLFIKLQHDCEQQSEHCEVAERLFMQMGQLSMMIDNIKETGQFRVPVVQEALGTERTLERLVEIYRNQLHNLQQSLNDPSDDNRLQIPLASLNSKRNELERVVNELADKISPLDGLLWSNWVQWKMRIDQIYSFMQTNMNTLEKLVRKLETAANCERELDSLLIPIEKEYEELKQLPKVESIDILNKCTLVLNSRLESDAELARNTLEGALEEVVRTIMQLKPGNLELDLQELITPLTLIGSSYQCRIEDLQTKLSQLCTDQSHLAESEMVLRNRLGEAIKMFSDLVSESGSYEAHICHIVKLDELTQAEAELLSLSSKLSKLLDRCQNLKDDATKCAILGSDMTALLDRLSAAQIEAENSVDACREFYQQCQLALTQIEEDLRECWKALCLIKFRITRLVEFSGETAAGSQSLVPGDIISEGADEMMCLLEEVRLAHELMKRRQLSISDGGERASFSPLVQSVRGLVQDSANHKLINERHEWIKLMQEMQLQENYLTEVMEQHSRVKRKFDEWDGRMSEVERALTTLQQQFIGIADDDDVDLMSSLNSCVAQNSLKEISFIQEQKLPELAECLEVLKNDVKDFAASERIACIRMFVDKKKTSQRLEKAELQYAWLERITGHLLDIQNRKLMETGELKDNVRDAIQWTNAFQQEVTEFEEMLPTLTNMQSAALPTSESVTKSMTKMDYLENKRVYAENLLNGLIERMQRSDDTSTRSQIPQLRKMLRQISTKIGYISNELAKAQHRIKAFNFRLQQDKLAVHQFGEKVNRLKDEESATEVVFKSDSSVICGKKEECKWADLIKEMEVYTSTQLGRLDTNEPESVFVSSSPALVKLREELGCLLEEARKKLELNHRFNQSSEESNKAMRAFEGSLAQALAEYGRITGNLCLDSIDTPVSTSSVSPSSLCEHIQSVTEVTKKQLECFQCNTLSEAQRSLQQALAQLELLNLGEQTKQFLSHTKFKQLQEDTMELHRQLEDLSSTLNKLKLEWERRETSLDNLERELLTWQPVLSRERKSPRLSFTYPSVTEEISTLSNEDEITEEAKLNRSRLLEIQLSYQRELEELHRLHKHLTEDKAESQNLGNRFGRIIRRMLSLVVPGEIRESDPVAQDYVRPAGVASICTHIEAFLGKYQNSFARVGELLNSGQSKLDVFKHFTQSIQDLDIWQLEFHSSLPNTVEHWSTIEQQSTSVVESAIQFSMDTGQTCVHSIHEGAKQVLSNDACLFTNDEVRYQIHRANQILQNAKSKYRKLAFKSEKQQESLKETSAEVTQFLAALEHWKTMIAELRSNLPASMFKCRTLSEYRDTEVDKWLLLVGDLKSEGTKWLGIMDDRFSVWLEKGAISKSQVDSAKSYLRDGMLTTSAYGAELMSLKSNLTEASNYLMEAKTWIQLTTEQFRNVCSGRVPVRLPTYIRDHSRAIVMQSTQSTWSALCDRPSLSHSSLERQQPIRTFEVTDLVQTYRHRIDLMEQMMRAVHTDGARIVEDLCSSADQLRTTLEALQIDAAPLSIPVEDVRDQIAQLESTSSNELKMLEFIMNLAMEFQAGILKWEGWCSTISQKLNELVQCNIMVSPDTSSENLAKESELLGSADVMRPISRILQGYQNLQNEVIALQSELKSLEQLSSDLQERCNQFCPKTTYNEIKGHYENFCKALAEVAPKLQSLQAEELEFNQNLHTLQQWLDEQGSNQQNLHDVVADPRESDRVLQITKNISEELNSNQSKLLELSDNADRLCRASSSVALAMTNLLVLHPVLTASSEGTVERAAHRVEPVRTETVGNRARRKVERLRKKWKLLTQSVANLTDLSSNIRAQQMQYDELNDRLRFWLQKCESRLEQLQSGLIVTPISERSTRNGRQGSDTHESLWMQYVEEHQKLLTEFEQKSAEFQKIKTLNAETVPLSRRRDGTDLWDTFVNLRSLIERRTRCLLKVQDNLMATLHALQQAERWIVIKNHELTSLSTTTGDGVTTHEANDSDIFGKSKVDSFAQPEMILRTIEMQGGHHRRRVHEALRSLVCHSMVEDSQQGSDSLLLDMQSESNEDNFLDDMHRAVQRRGRYLGNILMDVIHRTQEFELSYSNLCTEAQKLKESITNRAGHWKSYMELLSTVALYLTTELPRWWTQVSVKSDVAHSTFTMNTNINRTPIPTLKGRLERFSFETSEHHLRVAADSLMDVQQQQTSISAMESQLGTFRHNLITAATRAGAAIPDMSETSFGSIDVPVQFEDLQRTPTNQLAQTVHTAITRELRKFQDRRERLRELCALWERYTWERDHFVHWLKERQAVSKNLLETRRHSTTPENEEKRALEDFVLTLRDREKQLLTIAENHRELTKHNPNANDPILERTRAEFELLLTRSETRLRCVKSEEKNERSTGGVGKRRIPLSTDDVEALLRQSESTVRHTRLLNQLAKSVRKINQELSIQEGEDQKSLSALMNINRSVRATNRPTSCVPWPTQLESIRRNYRSLYPPTAMEVKPRCHRSLTPFAMLSSNAGVQSKRVRCWSDRKLIPSSVPSPLMSRQHPLTHGTYGRLVSSPQVNLPMRRCTSTDPKQVVRNEFTWKHSYEGVQPNSSVTEMSVCTRSASAAGNFHCAFKPSPRKRLFMEYQRNNKTCFWDLPSSNDHDFLPKPDDEICNFSSNSRVILFLFSTLQQPKPIPKFTFCIQIPKMHPVKRRHSYNASGALQQN
ncbi:unnamed protein product [Dicrocoelium dendriticum]|nr:unnamed protein product [Dicrocoelium dendriticum]